MESKQLPRSETAGPMRKSISWKTIGVTFLLICALIALGFILDFQLYGLLIYLGFMALITLAYAIKTRYWGENIKRWAGKQWEEDRRDS